MSKPPVINAKTFDMIQEYQDFALRTESPITPELLVRVLEVKQHLVHVLNDFSNVSKDLENLKRYIYYGKSAALDPAFLQAPDADELIPFSENMVVWARLLHSLLGLYGEGHEHVHAFDKTPLVSKCLSKYEPHFDRVNIPEEFGDNLWYIALGSSAVGINLLKIMRANIAKLEKRYPEKFTAEAAADRDLAAENSAMEKELQS